MMSSAEAEEAWCPPTFSPSRFGRTWLAWWIIHVDSQRTFWRSAWRQASVSGVMVLLEYALTSSRGADRRGAGPDTERRAVRDARRRDSRHRTRSPRASRASRPEGGGRPPRAHG